MNRTVAEPEMDPSRADFQLDKINDEIGQKLKDVVMLKKQKLEELEKQRDEESLLLKQ